jgi:hypothetical protein
MHLRYSSIAVSIALLCVVCTQPSCSSQSQEQFLFSSLDKTISQEIQSCRNTMEDEMILLLKQTNDPCSSEKAHRWLPVARTVEHLTLNLSAYILNLQQEEKKSRKDPASLHDSLQQQIRIYRDSLCASNERIKHYFTDRFDGLDTPYTKQADLITQLQLLKTATRSQLSLLLTQIRYSIMRTGTSMVSFCRDNTSCITESFDTYSAIIGQSTNILLPGQKLEIFAGMGAFSRSARPEIMINGNPCRLLEDGVARYPLTVSHTAGKHTVPVKIDYIDQAGIQRTISRTITYEVFEKK